MSGQATFADMMNVTQEQIESLKGRLREMNAGDLSILAALLDSLKQEEPVRLATLA
jgi:hypothetical protein